jgi:DNA-binding SARP family transcriptional activator
VNRLVARPRLIAELRRRHQLSLIALEAPAGYGRTVLLSQALSEGPVGPADLDVFYSCGPDDWQAGHLERAVLEACGGPASLGLTQRMPAEDGARRIASALGAMGSPDVQVALVVDNVERSGDVGGALWSELLDRLPNWCHLVLSGRRLPSVGLARHVAAGTGLLIDSEELAFTPEELSRLGKPLTELALADIELASWPALASLVRQGRPELVSDYIAETVLADVALPVAKALAALAAVDGCPSTLLKPIIGAAIDEVPPADLDDVIRHVARLPLVHWSEEGCWPHPIWADVTRSALNESERDRSIVAKVQGQVAARALGDAGRLALRAQNAEALRVVVRASLATQPPGASVADLKSWADSQVLAPDSLDGAFLNGVVHLALTDMRKTGINRLEKVRQAFEVAGDELGEVSLLLLLGQLARGRSDFTELARLLARAEVLAERGNTVAQGLVALGRAVTAQMASDPAEAVRILDLVPPGSMVGEWASQALIIKGTNLGLTGRWEAAIDALVAATGEGSVAIRALAHDGLAIARWYAGDPVGAIEDAKMAESLAQRTSAPAQVSLIRAAKACLLAATGQRDRTVDALQQLRGGTHMPHSVETRALADLAEVMLLADAGDVDGARSLLNGIPMTGRAVRSSVWKAALTAALQPEDSSDVATADTALSRAMAAGRSAAVHLAGGPLVGEQHRPFLPARWCAQAHPAVVITLSGSCRVERDFYSIDHPAWRRSRVRELCLHLALVDDTSRSGVAAALWPDRSEKSAGQNLRVTLTHLLDVLDPNRTKMSGSHLIIDAEGVLRFNRHSGLHIDIWDAVQHARAVLDTPEYQRPSLLAHARLLVSIKPGPLLGGVATGEWVELHRRRIDDLVVNASLHAGRHALAASDHELTGSLGSRALATNPWSERAHVLVVEAKLVEGDLDGARRALLHAVDTLNDLGATPGMPIVQLAYRMGLTRQAIVQKRRSIL